MKKQEPPFNYQYAKISPQAIELEERVLGNCLMFDQNKEALPWLKPEHFYRESHGMIWKAIQDTERPNLSNITQLLRKRKQLEDVGGVYALSVLESKFTNPISLEHHGRIIQQMFIKREIIRISGEMIRMAYDDAEDCIKLFDGFVDHIQAIESIFNPELSLKSISGKANEEKYIQDSRDNKIQLGLSTGFTCLDPFFRFKRKSFVIANGHDNVGKTAVMVYLAVVSCRLHKWKWIFACLENEEAFIRLETIQFAAGRPISQLSETEYRSWYDWSLENFTIIRIHNTMTARHLLEIATKIMRDKKHDAFLIDPYNALDEDKGKDKFFNSHQYHYEVTGKMRSFVKRFDCSIYLNCHAVTEALRRKHTEGNYIGYPMPPEKADTEGGGKFSNRADDFITFHRYLQHEKEFNICDVHVRKIKVVQTGGRTTPKDQPIRLRMIKGHYGFFDMEGNSPIVETKLSQFDLKPDQFSEPAKDEDLPF